MHPFFIDMALSSGINTEGVSQNMRIRLQQRYSPDNDPWMEKESFFDKKDNLSIISVLHRCCFSCMQECSAG
jgi:hypothetical protein